MIGPQLLLAAFLFGSTGSVADPPGATPLPMAAAPLPETPDGLLLMFEDERWSGDGALERMVREGPVEIRMAAVRSAGRIGDPALLGALSAALSADSPGLRREAAFAIGELADAAGAPPLELALADIEPEVRLAAIEALGKLRDPRAEKSLSERLLAADTSVDERGAILLQLWKLRSPEALRKAVEFLASENVSLRRRAAYCLLRGRSEDSAPELLARLADSDPTVRSLAARALGPTHAPEAVEPLIALLRQSRTEEPTPAAGSGEDLLADRAPMWQIRVSAARSLGELKDGRAEEALRESLGDPNPSVVAAAIEALGECGTSTSLPALEGLLTASSPRVRELALDAVARIDAAAGKRAAAHARSDAIWSVRSAAVRASGRIGDHEAIAQSFEDQDARVLAEALGVYAETRVPDVMDRLTPFLTHPDPVVRSVVLDRLAEPVEGAPDRTPALLAAWEQSKRDTILDARFSTLAALATRMADFSVQMIFFEALKDNDWLVRSRAVELMRLQGKKGDAIAAGRVGNGRGAEFYDELAAWARVARPRVTVQTARGDIVMDLWPAEAPLAVHNFITLARAGYYDGLLWHRVVPNFVVQTGCPRGDGWGGPGYAIRCEINSHRFVRGAVGMALAGKDTGGSQFFVAQSDQPHLDGGYSVFGRVIEGMSAVDSLAQGDALIAMTVAGSGAMPAESAGARPELLRWQPKGGVTGDAPRTRPRPVVAKPEVKKERKEDKASSPRNSAKEKETEEQPAETAERIKALEEKRAEKLERERRRAEERMLRERRKGDERREQDPKPAEATAESASPAAPARTVSTGDVTSPESDKAARDQQKSLEKAAEKEARLAKEESQKAARAAAKQEAAARRAAEKESKVKAKEARREEAAKDDRAQAQREAEARATSANAQPSKESRARSDEY